MYLLILSPVGAGRRFEHVAGTGRSCALDNLADAPSIPITPSRFSVRGGPSS